MDDLISRRSAIDAIMCEPTDAHYPSWYAERLEQLPSAQPVAKDIYVPVKDCISRQAVVALVEETETKRLKGEIDLTYAPMIKGIKALPSAQPMEDARAMCGECDAWNQYKNYPQPGWIPWDSGKLPKESGYYTVTAYDGTTKRVTHAKYQKRLKRWELTGARAYWRVLAWLPPIEPWEGEMDG